MKIGIQCPQCGDVGSKVVDSSKAPTLNSIRRRRECLKCAYRFTTVEHLVKEKDAKVKPVAKPARVMKRDWQLTDAAFALLTRKLREARLDYMALHADLEAFFENKDLTDAGALADKVIDTLSRKLEEGIAVEDVKRYCFGVAVNLAKEAWRHSEYDQQL
jgi:transcriptional regulator NrdR family protein